MSYQIRRPIPEDAAGLARVHVETWQSAYRGIVPDAFLESLTVAKHTELWTRWLGSPAPGVATFLAESTNGEIIGFVKAGPRRDGPSTFAGEILAIYVLAQHQGQGVGRALVRRAAQHLLEEGMSSMMLWVLSDGPARPFYEALGGKPVGIRTDQVGGVPLEETAYGWVKISNLR